MTIFKTASWDNPVIFNGQGDIVQVPTPAAPTRQSTAIRVLQVRFEGKLTKAAKAAGELKGYPARSALVSVHGVINKINYETVKNPAARSKKNGEVYFVEFIAVANDIEEAFYETQQGQSLKLTTKCTLLSHCYAEPLELTCDHAMTSILRCTIGPEGVTPVLMADGQHKHLRKGSGEPLFQPSDLLIHSVKFDIRPQKQLIQVPPKPLPVASTNLVKVGETHSKRHPRKSKAAQKPKQPTTMSVAFQKAVITIA